jgi:HSP20 family protein
VTARARLWIDDVLRRSLATEEDAMANMMRRDRGRGGGELQRGRGGLFDPFDVMRSMMGFDPFSALGGEDFTRATQNWLVPFDVKETNDAWIFKADVPGVKEEDLDVSVTGNVLSVSGKRECEAKGDDEQWHAYECSYGAFARSFTLPENADGEHVTADLSGGELKLTVPKRPEMQPRKVEIGGAKTKTDVTVKH